MKLTISQIAKMANVSRGTVDRVIHKRGEVSEETRKKIESIIQEYHYHPNAIGRALTNKKTYKIGVVIIQEDVPFFQVVRKGAMDAANMYADYAVELCIHDLKGLHEESYIQTLEDLKKDVDAFALIGYNTKRITQKVNEIIKEGFPVVTMNVDLPQSNRQCYIGIDNYQGGLCIATLVKDTCKEDAHILIMGGHKENKNEIDRINGFTKLIGEETKMQYSIVYTQDETDKIYDIVKAELENNAYDVIMNAGYGTHIMADVVKDLKLDQIKLFGYDLLSENETYLKSGQIAYLLDQSAYLQGNLPIMYLCEHLIHQTKLPSGHVSLPMTIYNKYNIFNNKIFAFHRTEVG